MQDCNLVLYNLNYLTKGSQASYAVWATGTTGQGAFPCTLTLQGTNSNGGSLTITDTAGKTVWTTLGQPLPQMSTIYAGQSLATGSRLYSPNGQYFITVQSDGNTVICECPLRLPAGPSTSVGGALRLQLKRD